MPVPSTAPISLTDIGTEFGATLPYGILDFLRGGAYVPNTAANAGVPTAAPIDILDFAGAAATHTVSVSQVTKAGANGTLLDSSTATVAKGKGPFTYLWSWASGGTGITIVNPTSVTTSLSSTGTNQVRSGVLQCAVTDTGNGSIVVSNTASVEFTHGVPP